MWKNPNVKERPIKKPIMHVFQDGMLKTSAGEEENIIIAAPDGRKIEFDFYKIGDVEYYEFYVKAKK